MTTQSIAAVLDTKQRGSFFTVHVRRPGHTRKGVTDLIEKVSTMQGILADYNQRRPVREAVENGERDEPELPSHIIESFTVGRTRFWRGKENKEYLPVCLSGNQPKSHWLLNGVEVTEDAVKPLLLSSEFRQRPSKEEVEDKGQAQFCAITLCNVEAIN